MWEVEDSNSEVKDLTETVELQIQKKSMGGNPIPIYSPQAPHPTPPMLSAALLLAQHAQKRHTKFEGGGGGACGE